MTNTKTDASLEKQENQAPRTPCPVCDYPAPVGKAFCSKTCDDKYNGTDALQRAIERLGAREVAPGRYAWRFKNAESAWYVSSAEDLANGYDALALLKRPATRKMKPWWSPDRQTAYRVVNSDGSYSSERFSNETEAWGRLAFGERLQRVTCDLMTGKEVLA